VTGEAPSERTAERGTPAPPSAADLTTWGLEPAWSRTIDVDSHDGGCYRWHLLDTATADPGATILCVHGNPTWGYAWKPLLAELGVHHRVIAVDQLGMGYSERTAPRRYVDRVADLDDVIAALDLDPAVPLIIAAHDWGGAVAMGWAVEHRDRATGMILCNTGIAFPPGRSAPGIIRLAASAPLLDLVCRGTRLFVEGTLLLSGRRISPTDRAALRAPYRSAPARAAIADFVDDIPLSPGDPSEAALADVAAQLATLDVPVLLAWGSHDPVFNDDFAADLAERLPRTSLHRFPRANHLVMLEVDVASVAASWLDDVFDSATSGAGLPPAGSGPD
jgi:pimeloyl-ACP methyl ester carboxylesterase